MALQTSGQISLNDIHVEAGGASGSYATINDADIRALIGKASGVQMAFNEWYGASASTDLLNTTMTIGSSTTSVEFGTWNWIWGTQTLGGYWVKNVGSQTSTNVYGYDGGADIYQDWTWVGDYTNSPWVTVWSQTPDTMGSVGSTSVNGSTLLYVYRSIRGVTNQLYLGFVGTAEVSFTSLSVNGNTFTKASASTGTYTGNRFYRWDSTDGVTSSTIPTSGSINVTIT